VQHQEMVDVTTVLDHVRRYIPGLHEACETCGWTGPPIEFKRHVYSPPWVWMKPGSGSRIADWLEDDSPVLRGLDIQVVRIYSGPSAEYPALPTPDDLLRGAGLGHLVQQEYLPDSDDDYLDDDGDYSDDPDW
jgi:hypothetical protein